MLGGLCIGSCEKTKVNMDFGKKNFVLETFLFAALI